MLPPLVACSSSASLWKSQPPELLLPSSSSISSQNVDNWFMPNTLDCHTLAQSLSCERPPLSDPALSSSPPQSRTTSLDPDFNSSNAQDFTATLRTLIHRQLQRQSAAGVQEQREGSNLSNAASSMATSDQLKEKPGSPINSSSGSSSNGSTSIAVAGDGGTAFLPQKQQENEVNIQAPTPAASFMKVEEGHIPASSSPWPGRNTPSTALSAQASVGAGVSKVSKRRSRASNKAPITVLSADTSNFRAMVQKFTGIPASSSPRTSASSMQARPDLQFWDRSTVSILKPQPTRLSPLHGFHGGSLPTLDTSMPFVLGGERSSSTFPLPARFLPSDNLLHTTFPSLPCLQLSQLKSNPSFSAAETGMNESSSSTHRSLLNVSPASDLKSLLKSNYASSTASMPSLCDPGEGDKLHREKCSNDSVLRNSWINDRSGGNSRNQAVYVQGGEPDHLSIRQVSSIENFLMEDDKQIMDPPGRSYNSVESWLSSDGAHTPKMELARNG